MTGRSTRLSKDGRVRTPAAIHDQLALQAGEAPTLSVVDGEVRMAKRIDAIRAMQKRLAGLRDPKNPAVDSLLRERRGAAEGD